MSFSTKRWNTGQRPGLRLFVGVPGWIFVSTAAFRLHAPRAETKKLQLVSEYSVFCQLSAGFFQRVHEAFARCNRGVLNSSAAGAGQVIMFFRIAVKAHLASPGIQFSYRPRAFQDIQIAIHSPQADPGNPFPHFFINLISGGVIGCGFDFLQDHPALWCHPVSFRIIQGLRPHSFISNHY